MIFLLLACSVEEPEPPEPAPVEGSAPGREMAFEYRPEGVELVPSLVELHAAMTAAGLQEAAVVRARAVEHKPDVVVANIAAARTGAAPPERTFKKPPKSQDKNHRDSADVRNAPPGARGPGGRGLHRPWRLFGVG